MKQRAARWFGLSSSNAQPVWAGRTTGYAGEETGWAGAQLDESGELAGRGPLAGLWYRTRDIWAGRTSGFAGEASGWAGAATQPYGGN